MSKRAILATLLAVAVISALILPAFLETDHPVMSEAWVRGVVAGLGMAGPLALIGLMVLVIVASPIPSGPIAVAVEQRVLEQQARRLREHRARRGPVLG